MCSGLVNQAGANGLKVVSNDAMSFDWNTLGKTKDNAALQAEWTAVLDKVIAADVDALAICDYGYGSEFALSYLRSRNWAPKSTLVSYIYEPFEDPSLLAYVVLPTAFSNRATFPAQLDFTDSNGYDELAHRVYNRHASSIMAQATIAGMIFSDALLHASYPLTDESVQLSLSTSQLTTFMGTSAFDVFHRQTIAALVTQFGSTTSEVRVVGPATAAADEFVYPMPHWNERTYKQKWGRGVEIAGVVLMAVGGAITLFWTIFMFAHWRHPVMLAASPVFCLAVLGGSLLVFASIFNWMPNLISDSICNLRPWLLPLGFMIMFGSLLAKTDRICRIYYGVYKSKAPVVITISNMHVAGIVLAIAFIQSILSILMVTVTKLQSKLHVVDIYRPSHNYEVCTFSTALKILFGINVGYAALLLGWGSYLAFRIRKVPIRMYDESKVIGFSIYNTAFFGAIVIVIQLAVGNNNRDVTFIITAICCFLGATLTTCSLFASKWFAIYRPTASSSSSDSTSSGPYRSNGTHMGARTASKSNFSSSGNSSKDGEVNTSSKAFEKERKRLKQRIKELKKELKKKTLKLDDERQKRCALKEKLKKGGKYEPTTDDDSSNSEDATEMDVAQKLATPSVDSIVEEKRNKKKGTPAAQTKAAAAPKQIQSPPQQNDAEDPSSSYSDSESDEEN